MDIVGLIPAGGTASRLGKLPVSKEVFPVVTGGTPVSVEVLSGHLLRYYRKAGITSVYFILRQGKWDIPGYFGDGSDLGMSIGYLIANLPYGTPFTVRQACPFVRDRMVAFGFPDIVLRPEDAFGRLREEMARSAPDILLGIFPVRDHLHWDRVEFDGDDHLKDIRIKQDRPDLKFGWAIALWRPVFTEYISSYLSDFLQDHQDGQFREGPSATRELCMGDLIKGALAKGLRVGHVRFEEGSCADLGTLAELKAHLTGPES